MSGRKLAFWIWTLVLILFTAWLFTALNASTSQDVSAPFKTSENRLVGVTGQNVSAKLASSGFFVLRQGNRVISGGQTTKPLGYDGSAYFVAEAENFSGTWEVVKADSTITVQLQNAASAIIYIKDSDKPFSAVLLSLVALLIWILGMVIASD